MAACALVKGWSSLKYDAFGNLFLVSFTVKVINRVRNHTLFADLATTLAGNFSIGLVGAIGGIIAARLLDPGGRGELAAAASWAFMLQALMQWGLGLTIVYFIKQDEQSPGSILSAVLILLVVQTLLTAFLGWVGTTYVLHATSPQIILSTRLYLATVPFTLLILYVGSLGQGLGRFRLFNAVRVLPSVAYMLIMISAWLLNIRQVPYIVGLLLAAYAVTGLGSLIWFTRNVHPLQPTSRQQIRQIFGYGMKTYIGVISWSINGSLDQFLMSIVIPLAQLGIYTVAVGYSSILLALSSAFAVVMYPRLVKSVNRRRMITTTLRITLFGAGASCIALAVACPILLPLLFGSRFTSSIQPAQVLLIGAVVLGINSVLGDSLHALGFPLQRSVCELIGMFVTVIGLWLTLPIYGIWGATLISVLSYSVVSLLMFYFVWKNKLLKAAPTDELVRA